MSIREFIEELKKLPYTFKRFNTSPLTPSDSKTAWKEIPLSKGALRTIGTRHKAICPICALANHRSGKETYHLNGGDAGRKLGLKQGSITLIMWAADGIYQGGRVETKAITNLRQAMEKALIK